MQQGKSLPAQRMSWNDIKKYDGEAPVTLELWRMESTLSLLSLLGQPWPGLVAPDRVWSRGQIEVFDI